MILVTGMLISPRSSSAQIPRQISYQGLLVSPSGSPISDGTHVLTVSFYDAPTGGSLLYSESIPTTTDRGLFNVIIGGNGTPIPVNPDFSSQYWLAISVDGGADMFPRTALTAVPYALNAQFAETANSVSPNATGVVTSINEIDGPIRIIGDSTTKVTMKDRVITISASPQGITSIQNTDGTITIIQPRGPTVTLNITDTSLTDTKFATGSVTNRVLGDASVTGTKINQMGALTGQVLKWDGNVWKPANDDTTKIAAGTGIVITTDVNGNNVISTTLIGLPPGILGQTLRHDGTNWLATSNLYNDGTNIGINTVNPGARLDIDGNVLISSTTGSASELRFQEPPGNGNFYTSFKATSQTVNIDYTLPPSLLATEGILATDPTGALTWRNVLPSAVTVPFNQITSGVNTGQNLVVGDGSTLRHQGTGIIDANSVSGATNNGSSYAGRVPIPPGQAVFTVNLSPNVGCNVNSSVTVSLFDQAGNGTLVGVMVTDINTDAFTVQFSANYPTPTGFLTYLVVNP